MTTEMYQYREEELKVGTDHRDPETLSIREGGEIVDETFRVSGPTTVVRVRIREPVDD